MTIYPPRPDPVFLYADPDNVAPYYVAIEDGRVVVRLRSYVAPQDAFTRLVGGSDEQ